MRALGEWVDYCRDEERRLRAPYLQWAVGGADFDYLLKATVGEAYLRALRAGKAPDGARDVAAREGDYCVSVNGAYELHRWNHAGRACADDVHARYLGLLGV